MQIDRSLPTDRATGADRPTGAELRLRRTRVGAYGLIRDTADRLLLCRVTAGLTDGGSWTLPGGGIEFGEDPAAAAIREVAEETGLRVELDRLAGVHSIMVDGNWTKNGLPLHMVGLIFLAHPVGGDLHDEVNGTTDACAWLGPTELSGLRLVPLAEEGLRLLGLELPASIPVPRGPVV